MLANLDDDVRRLQLETKSNINSLNKEISALSNTALNLETTNNSNNQKLPPINNLARNTDHSHSVDTWYNAIPAGDNQLHECAEVYVHPKMEAVAVLGSIENGTDLFDSPDADFPPSGLVGMRMIVYGAGPGGGKLVTTIAARNSDSQLQLSHNASTTVTNALARYNLQKLGRKNSKNSVDTENDTLKAETHSNFGSNIQDPKWDKSGGFVRLGSTNTLGYFLGTYDTDGTTFLPQGYGIEADRPMNVILKIAKAHAGVKPKGHFFAGIYNNNDDVLDYLTGTNFTLSAQVRGTPANTISTQYLVVAQTDRGYTYYSPIITVPDAPDGSSFVPNNIEVLLNWSPGIPATLSYLVYRKQGANNVELLEVVPNGQTQSRDVNQADRIDTGSANFPTPTADNAIKAYMATLLNSLDELAVDGVGKWQLLHLLIPMPSTIDMSEATELVLRIGQTQNCSLEVTNAITNATANVTSASGFFNAGKHSGKNCIIRDLQNPTNTLETTVASVTSENVIVLSDAPTWSSDANVLEIFDGELYGLVFDLVGLSFSNGEWSPHFDDNNKRPQLPASLPVGSSQGPVGDPNIPIYYGGGINCFIWSTLVTEFYSRKQILANDIYEGMSLYNGTEKPSIVRKVKRAFEKRLWKIQTTSGAISPPVTIFHRFLRSIKDAEIGVACKDFRPGDTILRFTGNSFIVDTVESIIPIDFPDEILIISVELEKQLTNQYSLLFLLNDFLSHNQKYEDFYMRELLMH